MGRPLRGAHDTLIGGSGNDSIVLLKGNNSVVAGSGNDTIWAGSGHDTVTTGTGNATIYGGGSTVVNETNAKSAIVSNHVVGGVTEITFSDGQTLEAKSATINFSGGGHITT